MIALSAQMWPLREKDTIKRKELQLELSWESDRESTEILNMGMYSNPPNLKIFLFGEVQFMFVVFFTLQYCIGFAIHQHESAADIYGFPILNPLPPPSPYLKL